MLQSKFSPFFDPIAQILERVAKSPILRYELEQESQEYAGAGFRLGALNCLFRKAKSTPTKLGFFVTLWKRSAQGPIRPFDRSDSIDFTFIYVNEVEQKGFFIFSKQLLIQQNIFSCEGQGGKRGFRVYPPFVRVESKQAIRTQNWQSRYYFDLKALDTQRLNSLLT